MNKLRDFVDILNKYNNFKLRGYQIDTVRDMIEDPKGVLVELETGGGKSALITSYAYIMSELDKDKNIFLVYSNDALALRDYQKYTNLYKDTVLLNNKFSIDTTKEKGLVVFTSVTNLSFNYLAGNIKDDMMDICIIDEVDLVLIDHAVNSFTISEDELDTTYSRVIIEITLEFLKHKVVKRTDKVKSSIRYSDNIIVIDDYKEVYIGDQILQDYTQLLKSLQLPTDYVMYLNTFVKMLSLEKYIHYVVIEGNVTPVDSALCRASLNSRFSIIEQNILEYLEEIPLTKANRIEKTISTQHLFYKFKTLHGVTGTVTKEIKKELANTFGLKLKKVKTNIPKRLKENYKAVEKREDIFNELDLILSYNRDNPVLIIVQDNILIKHLNNYLVNQKGISKNLYRIDIETTLDKELEIINNIKQGDILVSTKMLGRGVDINLDNLHLISIGVFEERDERQVKGRTARNGKYGEYTNIYVKSEKKYYKKYFKQLYTLGMHNRRLNLKYSIYEESLQKGMIKILMGKTLGEMIDIIANHIGDTKEVKVGEILVSDLVRNKNSFNEAELALHYDKFKFAEDIVIECFTSYRDILAVIYNSTYSKEAPDPAYLDILVDKVKEVENTMIMMYVEVLTKIVLESFYGEVQSV